MDVLAASSAASSSNSFAADVSSVGALRGKAATDPKSAIRDAAKQFESLFMNEVMKSMRQATMSSGMMDNAATQMGTEMLDTQFAGKMTGLKGGLGDAIIRQLERQMGTGASNAAGAGAKASPRLAALAPAGAAGQAASTGSVSQRQSDFVAAHTDAAQAAEAQTGIPATFMIAQAAHESGWGRRDIRNADGSPSHNLFGIKAGGSWTGPTAEVTTTEYINGQAHKVTAKFRAYASDAESFADYAKLMKDSPRYSQAVAAASKGTATSTTTAQHFAQNLQKAGYATDPAYADKLTKMINTTLRVQRSMA